MRRPRSVDYRPGCTSPHVSTPDPVPHSTVRRGVPNTRLSDEHYSRPHVGRGRQPLRAGSGDARGGSADVPDADTSGTPRVVVGRDRQRGDPLAGGGSSGAGTSRVGRAVAAADRAPITSPFMTLGDALLAIRQALVDSGVPFAVVGGMAVSARAEPRFTRDVDVAVVVRSDPEAEALVRSLLDQGWSLLAVVEQDATGRLAQARLRPPGDDPVVCDLLFASSGVEDLVVASAEPLEVVPGVVVPVARRAHLIALKLLSVDETRLQDRMDLAGLVTGADVHDRQETLDTVDVIVARGTNRDRDLISAAMALPWPSLDR